MFRFSRVQKNSDLPFLTKYAIFAPICFAMLVPRYINGMLNINYGIPYLPFTKAYFVAIPLIYAIHHALRRRSLRLPYIIEFSILVGTFVILESSLVRSNPIPEYDFIQRLIGIYILFIILVNLGNTPQIYRKVLDYGITCGKMICLATLAGYLGLIQAYAITYDIFSTGFIERPESEFNVNIISYICAFTMYLILVRMLNFERVRKQRFVDITFQSLLLLLIVVNSSRGAFIVASVVFVFYIFLLWKQVDSHKRLALLIVLPTCAGLAMTNLNFQVVEDINLVERYQETPEGRVMQLVVTWENFLENPWLGHGYYHAGKAYNSYTTRSNFMYTQILAAGGLLLFLIFFYVYYIRMLIGRLGHLFTPEIFVAFLFNLITFMFTRQFYYFGLFVFVVHYSWTIKYAYAKSSIGGRRLPRKLLSRVSFRSGISAGIHPETENV